MYNFLMKKPIFAIGILFFVIFLFQFQNSDYMKNRKKMYTAASCTAVTVRLNKVKPSDWKVDCQGTFADKSDTLIIEVPLITKNKEITPKVAAYRELANHLNFVAKNSPNDNLERTSWVKISVTHPTGQADGVIPGVMLAKMKTVETPAALAEHLKTSVRVKDNFPESQEKPQGEDK